MKVEIKVPSMGESISEATVGTIFKPTGSTVAVDDEILELETDKVNQALYAQEAGVVTLNVQQDQKVKIGEVLGSIDTEAAGKAEAKPAPSKEAPEKEEKPLLKTAVKAPEAKPKAPAPQSGSARFSRDDFIAGITKPEAAPQPVIREQAPAERAPAPRAAPRSGKPETRRKMSKVRRVIADRLVDALRTTAMLTTFNEVDMSQVITLREKYKETFLKEHGVKLGFMSFFVAAVVEALKAFPDVNSYLDGDEIVHRDYYDIGIAVGTEKGLFVPVVRDCDKLTFPEVEKSIEEHAKKAKDGTISVDDLSGGGFTITNGGVYGSLLSTPILNPPQCAILGMHKIEKRPIVINDQIVIRPMMYLALSYDHRIIDGKEAVSFLVHIKNFLEDPARLLIHV